MFRSKLGPSSGSDEGPSLDPNVVVNKPCVSYTVAFNYHVEPHYSGHLGARPKLDYRQIWIT